MEAESQVPANKAPPDAAHGLDPVGQNVETILAFYKREEEKIGRTQRLLEHVSAFMGSPGAVVCILLFVALWIVVDLLGPRFGGVEFDPPPFFWLQGVVGLGALLTATVVLIRQERLSRFEEQRAHLHLQVTLLTERKASKIIDLIEELRRDLPMVQDRHDPESAVLQEPTHPDRVLAAMDEQREADQPPGEGEKRK